MKNLSVVLVLISIVGFMMFYWIKTDKMVEDYAKNPQKYTKGEIKYYIDIK